MRLASLAAAAAVAPIAWLPAGLALAAPEETGLPATAPAPAASPRVVVTFAWGGGLDDQMSAVQMFGKYGMHATYFVPSGLVCVLSQAECRRSSPYLTIADLRKIAADGNEIGGLSITHQQLTTMPAAEAKREICDDRANLFRLGFRATDFAYPYAMVSPAVEALTRACGYNAGLGAGTLRGAGLCASCAPAETIPPQDPYNVRTPIEVNSVRTMWTPATFESIVTDAQQHGGGWIIFTIHDVCQANCSLGTTPAILSAVLRWLHDRSSRNVAVETMTQVIGGPVRPPVAGPAPLALPAPGVANADLGRASGGIPACFQPVSYGGSVARFSYHPGGGPHGSAAETVSLTRAGAGNAKLVQAMDLGLCAPPVSVGRAYTVGLWYESSRPAQIDMYRRTSLGAWSYWTTSTFFSASASWRQASWTTPAVPPDTTALSFGLTTNGVGTVTTSDYSLQPAKSYKMQIILGVLLFAMVAAGLIARGYYRYMKAEMADAEAEAATAKAELARALTQPARARADPARARADPAPVPVDPAPVPVEPVQAQAAPDQVQAGPASAQTRPVRAGPHLAGPGGGLRRTGRAELTHPGLAATPVGRYREPARRPGRAAGARHLTGHDAAAGPSVRGILVHLHEDEATLPLQSWLVDVRRLVLVDDFRMVTKALASRLSAASDLWVAGSCTSDDPKLPEVVRWLQPDVIVMEVEPLGLVVGEVVQRLLAAWPPARVVVVSGDHDVAQAVAAARAGAAAWVSEGGRAGTQGADELESVLHEVCQGNSWFPPEVLTPILRELRDDVRKAREDSDPLSVLTPRERDVLASMTEGKRAGEIAGHLLISIDTVRTHTRSIFTKLDVHSRPEAVRIARAAGLRPPERPATGDAGQPAAVPIRPRGRAGGDRPPARLRAAGSGSAVRALNEPEGRGAAGARGRGARNERRGKAAPVKGDEEAGGALEAGGEHR
jgi:DNA-binding NarL/FixJ family response regulator/peptidoglycan/xylan/chitin deacetylase (PgdA/CDA1 family)